MALHGYARLETYDAKTGYVMQRVEHKNIITPFMYNATTKGDFNCIMDRNKIMPLGPNWFGGCILTDKPNPVASGEGFVGMIAPDAEIIAMAGNDAYTGGNARRGSADLTTGMTGPISNGYRFVFRWNESHGNGHIESICLTRPNNGKVHFKQSGNLDYEDDSTLPVTYANEILSNGNANISEELRALSIVDYENEYGFKLTITPPERSQSIPYGGTMKIEKYAINTKGLHLSGDSLGVIKKIDEHNVEVKVPYNFRTAYGTVIYKGDKIILAYLPGEHAILPSGNHALLNVTIVDIANNYQATHYVRDYNANSGAELGNIRPIYTSTAGALTQDGFGFEMEGNTPYIYAVTSTDTSAYTTDYNMTLTKLGLDSDSNFDPVADEWWSHKTGSAYNGPWINMPNGDIYFTEASSDHAMYYHNGLWYRTNLRHNNNLQGIIGNVYGTTILKYNPVSSATVSCSLESMFPWVSTVNNLSEAVNKNITQTMSLVYEITET